MKKIIILLVSFILIGCDAEVKTTVKMSQLDDDYSFSTATLAIEVPSCTDYQDSRQESSSLIKAKNEITNLFKTIEYKECYSKEMQSFASFEIPVLVGSDTAKSKDLDKIDLAIVKQDQTVSIIALGEMRNKLDRLKGQNFSKLNVKITISFLNDTGKKLENISLTNKFFNGKPYDKAVFFLNPNSTANITLSDVSSQILLKTDKNKNSPQGFTEIMTFQ